MKNYISAILLCLSFEVLAQGTNSANQTTYQYFPEFPWGLTGSTTLNSDGTATQTQFNREGAIFDQFSYPSSLNSIANLNNNVVNQNQWNDSKNIPTQETTVFQAIGSLQIPFQISGWQYQNGKWINKVNYNATVSAIKNNDNSTVTTISTINQNLGPDFTLQSIPQTYVVTNNPQGNVSGIQFSENGQLQASYSFDYDNKGQLTKQTETFPLASGQDSITTTFNELGQPLTVTQGESGRVFTYNPNGEVLTINAHGPLGTASFVNTYNDNNLLTSTTLIQKDTQGVTNLYTVTKNTFDTDQVLASVTTNNYKPTDPNVLLSSSVKNYDAQGNLIEPATGISAPLTDKERIPTYTSGPRSVTQTGGI